MNSKQAEQNIDKITQMMADAGFPDAIMANEKPLGSLKTQTVSEDTPASSIKQTTSQIQSEIKDANFMCRKLVNAIKKVFNTQFKTEDELSNIPEIAYIKARSDLDVGSLELLCTQIENTVEASNALVISVTGVDADPKLYGMLSNLNKSLIDLLKYRAQLIEDLKSEYDNTVSDVETKIAMQKKTQKRPTVETVESTETTETVETAETVEQESTESSEQESTESPATEPPSTTLCIPADYKVDNTDYNVKFNQKSIDDTVDRLQGLTFSDTKELLSRI